MKNIGLLIISAFLLSFSASGQFYFGPTDSTDDEKPKTPEERRQFVVNDINQTGEYEIVVNEITDFIFTYKHTFLAESGHKYLIAAFSTAPKDKTILKVLQGDSDGDIIPIEDLNYEPENFKMGYLTPEHLGKVTVTLSQGKGLSSWYLIIAKTKESLGEKAKKFLMAQMDAIEASASSNGYSVAKELYANSPGQINSIYREIYPGNEYVIATKSSAERFGQKLVVEYWEPALVGDEGQWKKINEAVETENSMAYLPVNTREVPVQQKLKLKISSYLPTGTANQHTKVGYLILYKSMSNTGNDPASNLSEDNFYQP